MTRVVPHAVTISFPSGLLWDIDRENPVFSQLYLELGGFKCCLHLTQVVHLLHTTNNA